MTFSVKTHKPRKVREKRMHAIYKTIIVIQCVSCFSHIYSISYTFTAVLTNFSFAQLLMYTAIDILSLYLCIYFNKDIHIYSFVNTTSKHDDFLCIWKHVYSKKYFKAQNLIKTCQKFNFIVLKWCKTFY